jgi:two-component system, chemotaxis family, chemotaxis protein CheY
VLLACIRGTDKVTSPQQPAPTITILVVDDEPDMRLLARATLETAGLQVVSEAVNGPEAIAIFRKLDPPPVPTVVLLDNRMPGQRGLDVAAQLLASAPEQLVVLFTAFLDNEVEAEAARVGVQACVAKANVASLPAVIKTLVSSTQPRPT